MVTQPEQTSNTRSKELDRIVNEFWWNYIRLGGSDMDWFYQHLEPLVKLRNRAELRALGGDDKRRG